MARSLTRKIEPITLGAHWDRPARSDPFPFFPGFLPFRHRSGACSLMGPKFRVTLDDTAEPFFKLFELGGAAVTPENLLCYCLLFLDNVVTSQGRFLLVQPGDFIAWKPGTSEDQRTDVRKYIAPVRYCGEDDQGLWSLRANVFFKNALFRTDVKFAPRDLDVVAPDESEPYQIPAGGVTVWNERLVLADAPIVPENFLRGLLP